MRERRLGSVVMALALAVAFSVLAGGQAPKLDPLEKRIVPVPGNQPWTPTELLLFEKDKVTLTASGKVCFSAGHPQSCQGPEGWGRSEYAGSWPEDANMCDDPHPQFNHAMLIGKVGDEVFPVGASEVFDGRTGPLELGINDCSFNGAYHNTGQYTVIIRVDRAPRK